MGFSRRQRPEGGKGSALSCLLPEVDDADIVVATAGRNLSAVLVPAHFKYSSTATVGTDKAAVLDAPDMEILVERSASEVLSVWAERDAVNRVGVLGEAVEAYAPLCLPQLYGGIKAGTGEKQLLIGVCSARPRGAPGDGVDLLCVVREVVQAHVRLHGPDLGSKVITAACQQGPHGVPFDGVNLSRGGGGVGEAHLNKGGPTNPHKDGVGQNNKSRRAMTSSL